MSTLIQIIACCLDGTKPLPEPMLIYCQLDRKEHISMKLYLKCKYFHSRKCNSKCHQQNGCHFVSPSRYSHRPHALEVLLWSGHYLGHHVSMMSCGWGTCWKVVTFFSHDYKIRHVLLGFSLMTTELDMFFFGCKRFWRHFLWSRFHFQNDQGDQLTHWGWDKMAAILQTTAFTKTCQHGSIGSDNGLAPTRWQAISWTHDSLLKHIRHSASMS